MVHPNEEGNLRAFKENIDNQIGYFVGTIRTSEMIRALSEAAAALQREETEPTLRELKTRIAHLETAMARLVNCLKHADVPGGR